MKYFKLSPYLFVFSFLSFLSSCTNMALQPSKIEYFKVEQYTAQKPEQIWIESVDGIKLSAVKFNSLEKNTKGIVVQFHGNAENLSSHFLSQLWVTQFGYDLLSFDYRGYGKSKGVAGFPHVNWDAAAVIKYVRINYPDQEIILWGESLGGMIALNALNQLSDEMGEIFKFKMIFEGTFYSLKSTSSRILTRHWLTFPFSWLAYPLMSNRYAPKKQLKKLRNIPNEAVFIHSQHDPVVPFKQGKKLYQKYQASQKCKLWYKEKSHINAGGVAKRKYRQMILSFLQRGCTSIN